MSTIIRQLKKGFKAGIKSMLIEIDPPRRDVVPKGGVNRHWEAVGVYMRNSMKTLEESRDFQDRCDARYIKSVEQKKEEPENA